MGSKAKQKIVEEECRKIADKRLRSYCRNVIRRYTEDPEAISQGLFISRPYTAFSEQISKPKEAKVKGFFMSKHKK